MARNVPQNYPRVDDEDNKYYGLLDDTQLVQHDISRLPLEDVRELIAEAIKKASRKSGREILNITPESSAEEIGKIYEDAAWDLFKYFRNYATDPAATAHQIQGRTYKEIGAELFRNRTMQKERMNSAWRYQYFVVDCASQTGRFEQISGIGQMETDFNAVIAFEDKDRYARPLHLYVSVKNRSDTLGGQDWPKAIAALENMAVGDRNRDGPYCCVFGIAMDPGSNNRRMIKNQQSDNYYSVNTEVWRSNFFWPFFTNYEYEEIMLAFLDVLMQSYEADDLFTEIEIPDELLDIFGWYCRELELLDNNGVFNNPRAVVKFFCQEKIPAQKRKRS